MGLGIGLEECMQAKRVSAANSTLPSDASQKMKYTFVIDSHSTERLEATLITMLEYYTKIEI